MLISFFLLMKRFLNSDNIFTQTFVNDVKIYQTDEIFTILVKGKFSFQRNRFLVNK